MKRKQETASQPIHKAMRTRSKRDSGAAVHLAARSRQESPEQGGHELSPSSARGSAREAVRHKADLEALRSQDPEFYAYLEQTDKELLAFGVGSSADEAESSLEDTPSEQEEVEESDEEQVTEPANSKRTGVLQAAVKPIYGQVEAKQLTIASLEVICNNAKQTASVKSMEHLLKAYRVACHVSDSEDSMHAHLQLASHAVMDKLVLFMLKEAHAIFCHMLNLQGNCSVARLRTCARWPKVQPLIKSYLGNTLHMLGTLTHTSLLTFALRRLRSSTPFLASSEAILRKLMRFALQLMGTGDAAARVQAFLLVREMGTVLPPPTLSSAMKGVYRVFVRNAKFVTASSMPHIHFLGTCVVEMFGLDADAAYEHAFSHIRELAGLLRNALAQKTKDAYREVYCWQTTCTLELWGKLLGAHADKPELHGLAYPVAQLLMGALRLMPTPSFFPLRLRLARALVGLERDARILIPMGPPLLDMLSWKGLRQRASSAGGPGAGAAASTAPTIRAGKSLLATPGFQQNLLDQVLQAISQHLSHWAFAPSFPELAHIPLLRLRKLAKILPVERFRTSLKSLVTAVESQAVLVTQHRDALTCAPTDAQAMAGFMADKGLRAQAPLPRCSALLAQRAAQKRKLLSQDADGQPAQEQESDSDADLGAGASRDDEAPLKASAPHRGRLAKAAQQSKLEAASSAAFSADIEDVAFEGADDLLGEYIPSDDDAE